MPNKTLITENTGIVRSREPEGKTKTPTAYRGAWNKKVNLIVYVERLFTVPDTK